MRYAVYLLCFPGAPEGPDHYVGITTPERVQARMQEHRSGRGAKRTKLACERGETWFHTLTLHTCCRDLEQRLQRYENVTALCPRCARGLDFPPLTAYPKADAIRFERGLPILTPK